MKLYQNDQLKGVYMSKKRESISSSEVSQNSPRSPLSKGETSKFGEVRRISEISLDRSKLEVPPTTGEQLNSVPRKPIRLTAKQVKYALDSTRSIKEAYTYLNVSRNTLKRYAKIHFGEGFIDKYANAGGKGIPRYVESKNWRREMSDILGGKFNGTNFDRRQLKERLINELVLEERCANCGFDTKRIVDHRAPMMIHYVNGNRTDYRRENLQLLCYNCYFLYVGNIHGKKTEYIPMYNPLTGEAIDELKF